MTGRKQQSSSAAVFQLAFYISPAHVNYLVALTAQSNFEVSTRTEVLCGAWGGALRGEAGVLHVMVMACLSGVNLSGFLKHGASFFLHTQYLRMQLTCRNEAKAMNLGNRGAA